MTTTREKILLELENLYSKKPKHRKQFLESPQAILNGEVPNEMIAAGRGKEVLNALRTVFE